MRSSIRSAFVAVVLAAMPAAASASGLDLRIGAFSPRGDSTLFEDDAALYGTRTDDFRGITGGAELALDLGDHWEVSLHVDGYGREVQSSYLDFETPSGRDITQSLRLAIVPVGISLKLLIGDPDGRVVPYLAAGPDLVYWRYEEEGDFVDFDDDDLPIIGDHFLSEGTTPGLHAAVGARIRVSHDVSVTGEARYLWAGTDMGQDFRGSRLDLNGLGVTFGVNLRF